MGSDTIAPWVIANVWAQLLPLSPGLLQNAGYHLQEQKTQKPIQCIRFFPAALRTVHLPVSGRL
jgi:hypothetical protein